MYCQSKIQEKLHAARLHLGWQPEYHSVDECDFMVKRLNAAIEIDNSRHITFIRELTQKEINWIRNERAVCFSDAMYFKLRYAWLSDETNNLIRYKPRRSQLIFHNVIADLEEKGHSIEIQALKGRQVGMCLSPETRILTADLRWKLLEDVSVGDELVACDEGDEFPLWRRRWRNRRDGITEPKVPERKMRTAVVEAKWVVHQPALRITLGDGRILLCTPDHKFLVRKNEGEAIFREAKYLGVGYEMRHITTPWGESTVEDGWFGGFLDGEGCLSRSSETGTEVTGSQRLNEVYDRAKRYLQERGYNFRDELDQRPAKEGGKFGSKDVARLSVARAEELFRLLGQTRPIRFITRRWWEGKSLPGRKTGKSWASIVSVELLPPRRMIDLQTSTKTFVAEGIVSHNSTEVELDFTHRLIFVPGCQAITASADSQKSELMVRMFYTAIENLPWWMVPQIRKNRRSGGRGLLEFHTGSIIAVQSGAQETGIGQGWTPTNIHISEACDYQNAKKTLEEGLLRACHSTPSLFLVFESTGNGNTGWWPETWRSSKEFYWQGRARLLPLFIPWYAATDLYPEPSWLEKFPIPVDWRPSSECRRHAAKAKAFVRSTPYLQKEFGLGWEMPTEQMWFWDFNYQEAVRKRAGKSWVRQMPGDDHEALQGSHDSVFDPETINVVTKDRRTEYQVYGIVGEGIDERHEPHVSEVDYTDAAPPRIEIEWDSPRGMKFQWMLVPLKPIEESDEKTAMTKLIVYEPPIPGCDYGIGADTAEGHGEEGDRTVFCVTRKGAIGQPDIQAAEFCSDVVSTADSAAFIACLATWYGKGIAGWGMPVIAIEQRRKPGDDAQNQLIKMGFHRHYKFHRLDGKNSEREEQRANRLGWYTTEWSRAYLHGRFIEAIDNRWFEANSIFLIRECDGLEHSRGGKKSTIDHKEGKHDDRVFAAGISIVILHTREVHLERAQKRYAAPRDSMPKIDMTTPTELTFSVGNF